MSGGRAATREVSGLAAQPATKRRPAPLACAASSAGSTVDLVPDERPVQAQQAGPPAGGHRPCLPSGASHSLPCPEVGAPARAARAPREAAIIGQPMSLTGAARDSSQTRGPGTGAILIPGHMAF